MDSDHEETNEKQTTKGPTGWVKIALNATWIFSLGLTIGTLAMLIVYKSQWCEGSDLKIALWVIFAAHCYSLFTPLFNCLLTFIPCCMCISCCGELVALVFSVAAYAYGNYELYYSRDTCFE